jgi:hypothetical protein
VFTVVLECLNQSPVALTKELDEDRVPINTGNFIFGGIWFLAQVSV